MKKDRQKISCAEWKILTSRLLVRVGKQMAPSELEAVTSFIQLVEPEDFIMSHDDNKTTY